MRPSRGLTLTLAALRQKWVRLSQELQTSFLFIASLRKSGVSEHRPLGKRGLAGPVLLHKSYLCPAPGPRSVSRAGLQQPVLDRVSTCWWGTVLRTKGLLSSAPPAPETRSPGGSRLLLMLVANPAPIHKASGIASHEPSAVWHPPVGSPATCTWEPRHPRCPSLLCVHLLLPFSHSVVSNSLRPHGLQHARLPCPPLSPGVCSDSCPLSCDAIQPSHPLSSPSPPALDLSQPQGLFQ